jgi:DNA polymerase I-like protein with 3'-5' exonuclease and polymerase domains
LTHVVKFYSEQKMVPAAREILGFAVREVYGDEKVRFEKVSAPGPGVLSFGKRGKGVYTLSPKQMLVVPNAVSVLTQSLKVYRDGYPLPKYRYNVVSDPQEVIEWLPKMIDQTFDKPVALDTEWDKDGNVISFAMYYGYTQTATVFSEEVMTNPVARTAVYDYVARHYYTIWANGKADQVTIARSTGKRVPCWFDTMLAHHSLHPSATGQHGLKEMAERTFGVEDWDKDLYKYSGKGDKADYGKVPREMLYEYNGYDVYYTFWLYDYFLALVEEHPAFWYEVKWANAFVEVETYGIKVDLDHALDMKERLEREAQEPLRVLQEEYGLENPNSPVQVKRALAASGLNLKSTEAKVLEEHSDHPLVATLLHYRKLTKQISTYYGAYEKYADEDGIVHPTFNIHGTGSGRTSCSRPNVQNQPRDVNIRNSFLARREDYVIIECDYAQGENRVQALLSGDPAMIAAFQPDAGDFFDLMMPIAFPEIFPTVEDYKALKAKDKAAAKEYRAKVKGVDYGQAFGRGAAAIAKAIGSTTEEAQSIIDSKRAAYPLHAEWRDKIIKAATDEEYRDMLTTPHGLRFDFEVVRTGNKASIERSALSFLPQGCLAFIGLNALAAVVRRLKTEYPEAHVINFVHDAIHVEAPRAIADEVGALVQFEMEQAGRDAFGDAVIFNAEPEYAYRLGGLMD